MTDFLFDVWVLVNEMAPYLLLGFLLAGLMHEFVPGSMYQRFLSGSNTRSVLLSALFGIPLPLCSCGVIPTAMGLRRNGASQGATVSFLVSTPQTGIDSIIATFSLMGLAFTFVRPMAALVTAVFAGVMVNMLGSKKEHCCCHHHEEHEEEHCCCGHHEEHDEGHCCCGHHEEHEEGHCCCGYHEESHSFGGRLKKALVYGFDEMMTDIGKWLVVGLLVAGVITALVPDSWFALFKDNSLYSILFVLLFSLPMYLCATGSIPIAVALMMKGLTPGAALVLLMAGPASNAASILVINKVLGRRTLVVYLLSIVAGAVTFGLCIDYLMPREWFTTSLTAVDSCCEAAPDWFSITCTVVLIVLLVHALWPFRAKHECHCHE